MCYIYIYISEKLRLVMSLPKIVIVLLVTLNITRLGCSAVPQSFYGCDRELTLFRDSYTTFCDAMIFCQLWKPGATLAMPKTKCIDAVVTELVLGTGIAHFRPFLGATDMMAESKWMWLDGTPMDVYKNWGWNEPNGRTGENCMQTIYDKHWNDVPCTRMRFPYICQLDLSKITSSDYKDAVFIRQTVNFVDARKGCESRGSRLVEITDEKSFETVRNNMGKNSRKKYWIGANFTSDGWKWLSGAEFGFQKWLQGQPSRRGTNRCLAMTYNGFSDYECDDYSFRYICETVRPHNLVISEERPVIVESQSIEISCTASAYPPPVVQWIRENTLVVEDITHDIHQVIGDANAKLVIHNAGLKDGGKYYCHAMDTINGTKVTIKGFTNVKVIHQGDDIETTVQNWKLEESDKLRNYTTTTAQIQSHTTLTTYGQVPCKKPTWILPVFLILGVVAVVLSVAVAVLLYPRFSKLQIFRREY